MSKVNKVQQICYTLPVVSAAAEHNFSEVCIKI